MSRVRFGDVAREIRKTSREVSGLRVVGLEHLEPENINLEQWAESNDNTFSKLFSKGQVLFGRRRAYLKKAALATFDGVCSGDITVIEAIPGILDADILPFIVQNDAFFDFAVGGSAGSLSPRVKWEHLSQYEFNLPPLEEQKKLAKVLWAMERTKRAYKELLNQSAALAKSLFVEMFGDPEKNEKKFPLFTVGDLISFQGGSQPPRKFFETTPSKDNIRFIQIRDYKSDNYITYIPRSLARRFCTADDIMIGRYGPPIFQILKGIEGSYNVALIKATPLKGNREFVRSFLKQDCLLHYIESLSGRTAGQDGIQLDALKRYPFPFPPQELQDRWEIFIRQLDKSQFALKESLSKLTAAQKALMNQAFEK